MDYAQRRGASGNRMATATEGGGTGTAARSLRNFRQPFVIARNRWSRRGHRLLPLTWSLWTAAWLALIVVCAAFLDEAAMSMRDHWPSWLQRLAHGTTDIAQSGWFLAPAALVLLVANVTDWGRVGRARLKLLYDWTSLAFFVLVAVGLGGLLALFLKYSIGRARPRHFDELGAFTFTPTPFEADFASFPSGHATTAGAVTAILFLLFPAFRPIVLAVGIWIAATRVVTGSHYPSDVAAGFGLGMMFAFLSAAVFARLGFIFRFNPGGLPVRRHLFRLGLMPSRRGGREVQQATESASIPETLGGTGPDRRENRTVTSTGDPHRRSQPGGMAPHRPTSKGRD